MVVVFDEAKFLRSVSGRALSSKEFWLTCPFIECVGSIEKLFAENSPAGKEGRMCAADISDTTSSFA